MEPQLGDHMHSLPLPLEPTRHLPGTRDKQAVMAERLLEGYHIHHPDDARLNQDDRCMLPIIHPKNHKILNYRVVTENVYHAEVASEPWWGVRAGKAAQREHHAGDYD